jgi:hypothetical protein
VLPKAHHDSTRRVDPGGRPAVDGAHEIASRFDGAKGRQPQMQLALGASFEPGIVRHIHEQIRFGAHGFAARLGEDVLEANEHCGPHGSRVERQSVFAGAKAHPPTERLAKPRKRTREGDELAEP